MTKLVVLELTNATADDNLVRILCTVPFKSASDKVDHRTKLDQLRDDSQKTIFALDTMTGRKTRVQVTKAARDKVDDSYWDNGDIELARERGEAKLAEYRTKAEEHIAELTNLMYQVSTLKRMQLMLLAPKAAPKALPPG